MTGAAPGGWSAGPFTRPWPLRAGAVGVAALVVGPGLAPGFVLVRDMVFVPHQPLGDAALGLAGALPRAVPVDAVVALLTTVLPGQALQKVVLVGLVVAALLGAARLGPRGPDGAVGVGSVTAAAVYGWSPYLAERLLMGHWALLLAWAALPWVVVHGCAVRELRPGALPRLLLALAVAAVTPTGSVLSAVAAVVMVGRRRVAGVVAVLAVALAAPWIVAGLLHPGAGVSDPAGVAAFAVRADGPGGVVTSLLGGGGIWNAAAVPPGRSSVVVVPVALALLALALIGWTGPYRRHGPGLRLTALGAAGIALGLAGILPGVSSVLADAVAHVPGAGLLRDGHKWVAWWLPALAAGAGAGAARAARVVAGVPGGTAARRGAGVGLAVVLLAVLSVPDLAWGVGGRLRSVPYPPDWDRVAAVLAADRGPGAVLALPVGAVRAFAWNDGRVQLDPAPRYLPREVVVTDDLVVGDRTVAGEDAVARDVLAAAGDPARLAATGVGWVLVEHGTPGPPVPDWVRSAVPTVAGTWLTLVRVPDARPATAPSPGRVAGVVGAHLLALAIVAGALVMLVRSHCGATVGRRRRSTEADR